MPNKIIDTSCFWCEVSINQRIDTYRRQLENYGHNCCKKCFGNEPTFKAARTKVMLSNNPFKGKNHTEHVKRLLSDQKIGSVPWNKGLTKETSQSIMLYSINVSLSKTGRQFGSLNPNWRGGISAKKKPPRKLKDWLLFRKYILERDCDRCWKCGGSIRLQVHHIASQTQHRDKVFDEDNCIVLCYSCHQGFHRKYGRKRFTPRDTAIFLNENREPKDFVVFC